MIRFCFDQKERKYFYRTVSQLLVACCLSATNMQHATDITTHTSLEPHEFNRLEGEKFASVISLT